MPRKTTSTVRASPSGCVRSSLDGVGARVHTRVLADAAPRATASLSDWPVCCCWPAAHAWVIEEPYPIFDAPVELEARLPGSVMASLLEWPASCIRLRGGTPEAIGRLLEVIVAREPCHNIAVIGRDVYCFPRSADGETSAAVPDLKIGAVQLLGLFVVDTATQFEAAVQDGAIESTLRDTCTVTPLADLLTSLEACDLDL